MFQMRLQDLRPLCMLKTWLKLLTPADVILIMVILAGAAGSCFLISHQKAGALAYIYREDALFGIYELNKSQTIIISESCTAEIRDGRIRMLSSDCPDQICVRQGWTNALPIICQPNRIVIEIRSSEQSEQMHILH